MTDEQREIIAAMDRVIEAHDGPAWWQVLLLAGVLVASPWALLVLF